MVSAVPSVHPFRQGMYSFSFLSLDSSLGIVSNFCFGLRVDQFDTSLRIYIICLCVISNIAFVLVKIADNTVELFTTDKAIFMVYLFSSTIMSLSYEMLILYYFIVSESIRF
jgi:hypothetical protein